MIRGRAGRAPLWGLLALPMACLLTACGAHPASTPTPPPPAQGPLPQPLLDFTRALELTPDDLCQRIGPDACAGRRPIDPDRAAVAACLARRALEQADPVFWRDVVLRDPGHLMDVDAPAVRAAVDALFLRTQLAPAGHHQWAQLRKMYVQLDSERAAPWPDWAVLVCFAALQQLKHW